MSIPIYTYPLPRVSIGSIETVIETNGTISVKCCRLIVSQFGFGIWGSEWSNFSHQSSWKSGKVYVGNEVTVRGISALDQLGIVVSYETKVVSKGLFIVANFSLELSRSENTYRVAIGSWTLKTNIYMGRRLFLLGWGSDIEVMLPKSIARNGRIAEKYGCFAILFPVEKGGLAIFLPGSAKVSIDDERIWGSNTYSVKVWIDQQSEKFVNVSVLFYKYNSIEEAKNLVRALKILFIAKKLGLINKSTISEFWDYVFSEHFDEAYSLINFSLKIERNYLSDNLRWLMVKNRYIVDENGNYVILRGTNYMGLEFGWFGHKEEDFKKIAKWGFNVVRLPIGWGYIEPSPGYIDHLYLTLIKHIVAIANRHGLYVILDMHQWHWSPKYGGCGMPDWLIPEAKDYYEASARFFSNRSYWEKFANTWKLIAMEFRDNPGVAGYDVFNEPMPADNIIPKDRFAKQVSEFYQYVFSEIRRVDSKHILFYQPIWGSDIEHVPEISGDNIVLSIHYYVGGTWDGVTGYEYSNYILHKYVIGKWVEKAKRIGVPLWIGEFGVGSSAYKSSKWVHDVTEIFDSFGLGYCWWTFWRDDRGFGLLYLNGSEKTNIVRYLNRPYPMLATAPIESIKVNFKERKLSIVFLPNKDETTFVLYLPTHVFQEGISFRSSYGEISFTPLEKNIYRIIIDGLEKRKTLIHVIDPPTEKDIFTIDIFTIPAFTIILAFLAFLYRKKNLRLFSEKSIFLRRGKLRFQNSFYTK